MGFFVNKLVIASSHVTRNPVTDPKASPLCTFRHARQILRIS